MTTKLTAGNDDCYARLEPDEPYFCLMARDPDFSLVIRQWAFNRRLQIESGVRPDTKENNEQISQALECAQDGKSWRDGWMLKKELAGMEFDREGYPTTGPHRRRQTTTSGEDMLVKAVKE